jgi:hypothetical protein
MKARRRAKSDQTVTLGPAGRNGDFVGLMSSTNVIPANFSARDFGSEIGEEDAD